MLFIFAMDDLNVRDMLLVAGQPIIMAESALLVSLSKVQISEATIKNILKIKSPNTHYKIDNAIYNTYFYIKNN